MAVININSVQNTASVSAVTGKDAYSPVNSVPADKTSGVNRYDTKYKLYHLMGPEKDYNQNYGVNTAYEPKNNPAVNNIKSVSEALKKTADSITARFPPLFNQMKAAIDNNDALSVTGINSFSVKEETTEVNVVQTASAQENEGNELKTGEMDFDMGSNRFKIRTGRGDFNFNVNVTDNDNNRSVLNKVSDSINRRDIGLNARVAYNGENETGALVVSSQNTGEENTFSIQDKDGGNLVERTGANNTVTEARDALYSVNGGMLRSSPSNEVYIGNGLSAELKNPSEGSVKISLTRDTEKIKDKVSEFINGFNDFLKTAKEDLNSEKIAGQLKSAFNAYSLGLEESGVFYDHADGGLITDEKKLNASIADSGLEKALGASADSAGGFAERVGRIARNIQTDPLKYAGGIQNGGVSPRPDESNVTGMGMLYNTVI